MEHQLAVKEKQQQQRKEEVGTTVWGFLEALAGEYTGYLSSAKALGATATHAELVYIV
jgi:hypothetical protein